MADQKYRAKVDLWYWPKTVKRAARSSENQKKAKAKAKLPDDFPAVSLPWLLADGLVEGTDA